MDKKKKKKKAIPINGTFIVLALRKKPASLIICALNMTELDKKRGRPKSSIDLLQYHF
jgi:hypothetical protein